VEFNFGVSNFLTKFLPHFDPISNPFRLFFSQREKKSNFADRAKIREIKFRENFFT